MWGGKERISRGKGDGSPGGTELMWHHPRRAQGREAGAQGWLQEREGTWSGREDAGGLPKKSCQGLFFRRERQWVRMEATPGAWESSDVGDKRKGGGGMEEEGTGMALCQLQHTWAEKCDAGAPEQPPAPKGAKALPPLWESTSQPVSLHGWHCTV